MSKTDEYLKEAFSGETQANRKYLAFAAKAEQEGHLQAARLFRAASEAEAVHANNHLLAMNGIKGTKENLREAIAGETQEFKEMYPAMIKAAKSEGNRAAERSFVYANAVERIHADLYHMMLETFDTVKETYPYYICPVCGMTAEREPPERCPICGAKGERFKRIE
jgi:rubrerythrin